jgi:hypothetical protein
MSRAYAVASHVPTNGAVVLLLAGYIAVVTYQGNFGTLVNAVRQDFIGGAGHRAFWKWALALVILIALAQSSRVGFLFGPALTIALVAMLLEIATTQPEMIKNLSASLNSIFSG